MEEQLSDIPEARIRRALKMLEAVGGRPPGHWGSPYPSDEDVSRVARTMEAPPTHLPGIDLRVTEQLDLVQELAQHRGGFELPERPSPPRRFHHANPFFGYGDANALYAMMRHLRPSRIIEVGSGYSSALMLDVSEQFFDASIEFVFIEPHPSRLHELARSEDLDRAEVIASPVQDAPLALFDRLCEGDILFIDSSHVTKMGSDVNYLFLEVLPRIKPGVHVQVHDIFYPFDYPRDAVKDKRRAWGEAHLLRAFLHFNDQFQISLFCDYLRRFRSEAVGSVYPELISGAPGSIWLRRT